MISFSVLSYNNYTLFFYKKVVVFLNLQNTILTNLNWFSNNIILIHVYWSIPKSILSSHDIAVIHFTYLYPVFDKLR